MRTHTSNVSSPRCKTILLPPTGTSDAKDGKGSTASSKASPNKTNMESTSEQSKFCKLNICSWGEVKPLAQERGICSCFGVVYVKWLTKRLQVRGEGEGKREGEGEQALKNSFHFAPSEHLFVLAPSCAYDPSQPECSGKKSIICKSLLFFLPVHGSVLLTLG